MKTQWLAQVAAIVRLEMHKTVLARRVLWLCLLATAGTLLQWIAMFAHFSVVFTAPVLLVPGCK